MTSTTQTDTAAEVRSLVEAWARAVETEDMDGLIAPHSDDVVMFDVPPPLQLVGLDAYRQSWPQFFEHQRGGVFRWQELHVVAGEDVAFCFGIVTCGAADPATHFPVRVVDRPGAAGRRMADRARAPLGADQLLTPTRGWRPVEVSRG